jgi:hypothetical protein
MGDYETYGTAKSPAGTDRNLSENYSFNELRNRLNASPEARSEDVNWR